MRMISIAKPTIIVNTDIQALKRRLETIPDIWAKLSVGREISHFLISQEVGNYPLSITKFLADVAFLYVKQPVVFYDIDILFEPSIQIDPLNLFRQIGRQNVLIIFWPGTFVGDTLVYAQPEHHHYRFWKNVNDVEIIGVNDAIQ